MEKSNLFTKQKNTSKDNIQNMYNINASYEKFTVIKRNELYGVLDEDGNLVCEPKFYDVVWISDDKAIVVTKDGKMGLINSKGDIILDTKWKRIIIISNNTLVIKEGNKLGLADINGNIIHQPKWNHIGCFGNQLGVEEDNKWGLLNVDGTVIVPPKWEVLAYSKIHHNLLVSTKGLGTYILDDKGVTLEKLTDEEIEEWFKNAEPKTIGEEKKIWDELYKPCYGKLFEKHKGISYIVNGTAKYYQFADCNLELPLRYLLKSVLDAYKSMCLFTNKRIQAFQITTQEQAEPIDIT